MYSLIVTAKMNDVDPQAWLADVLARIADIPCKSSTSCCPGIGVCSGSRSIRQLDHGRDKLRLHYHPCRKNTREDEDWLHEICNEMDPEDGRLTVLGPGEA